MNKNDKDFMDQLSNLDDSSVEEIAENYPALYGNTKKRILKKCLKKDGFSNEIEGDGKEVITISGTERYKSRPWYRFAASAAAFVVAVVGITSVFMLNRNFNGNDIPETEKTSVLSIYDSWSDSKTTQATSDSKTTQATVVSSDKDKVDDSFGYWGTNDNETSHTPTTAKEPPVNNSNNSVPQTNTPTTPAQYPPPEPQRSFLNGLYYVGISGIDGYMGFEFMPDGTLTKYFFDETRNAIGSTIVKTNYEIVENKFSFGDKTGTIVNPNDTENFSVQFDDGDIFNFSTQQPILTFREFYFIGTKPDTLNGTIWAKCFGDMDENYNYTDRRTIEFKEDGISGTVYILSHPRNVTKSTITEIPFTYEQNGDEIIFYMENSAYAMVKAEIKYSSSLETYGLNVEYQEADEWGNTLKSFGQTGCLNDHNYNY